MILATRPREPVEKGLHDAADRFIGVLRRRWLALVSSLAGGLNLRDLARRLESGDPAPLQTLGVPQALDHGVEAAVTDVAESIVGRVGPQTLDRGGFTMSFNLTNPHAVEAVQTVVREALQGIQTADRGAIEDAIRRGVFEGRTPQQTARTIRDLIGLTRRQASTLARFRASLEEQGLPPARTADIVERFRQRQIRQRAETIARTETIRASAAGQVAAWEQARAAGTLPADAILRRQFVTGAGTLVERPPAHPRCRCALALKRVRGVWVVMWVVTPDDRLCPICRPIPTLEANRV